jgi:hypothetical protein
MKKFNWSKQNTILSKKLTVAGSLILLLAFIIQTFMYNNWNEKVKLFEQANRDYTEMTRSSLEYQNLFLGLESQNDSIKEIFKPMFIKAAAEKYRLGKIISSNPDLFNNEKELNQFISNTNKLLLLINEVKDLKTLYQFVGVAERYIPENQKLKTDWMNDMNRKKEIASYLFILFQLTGAVLVALGFKYQ